VARREPQALEHIPYMPVVGPRDAESSIHLNQAKINRWRETF
jgi:hypothetical protein